MKKFLQLIEVARSEGIISGIQDGSDRRIFNYESFWKAVEDCKPFVFVPKNGDVKEVEELEQALGFDQREMDAPFRVFSIEMLGDNNYVTIPRSNDEVKIYTSCILIEEISPKVFCYYSLCEVRSGGILKQVVLVTNTQGAIVEEFLSRLKKEACGIEAIRARVKVGSGKDKRIVTFRKIIHVKSKAQLSKDLTSGVGVTINWSHRWSVRGHWRVISGLGKNREGQYCVFGHTWITEHEKGPEDAPLITKTRLVKNSAE